MDFAQWHARATRRLRPLPPPIGAGHLDAMTPDARREYADDLRAALLQRQVTSPEHERTRGELTRNLQSTLLEPPGARTILTLSAPWGVGKSTLVESWAETQHRAWLGEKVDEARPQWEPSPGITADLVPVIYLTLLSESRSKDLYAQILHFIGYPTTGAERTIALAAVKALSTHDVRMIVVDDAHMLRTKSATGRATLNAVKHLNTELGEADGCMVLVGAELTKGEALADPQIRTRLAEHHLRPYGVDGTSDRRAWQHLLKTCEKLLLPYLPGSTPGLLASQHAAYLWMRTQGFVGDTFKLLVGGAHSALADGEGLSREHLDAVRLSQRAQDGWDDLNRQPPGPRRKLRNEK